MYNRIAPTNRIFRGIIAGLAILACAWFARADDPPSNAIRLKIDLKKSIGLMDYYPSDEIADDAAQDANGIDFTINGTLTSRRGWRAGYKFKNPTGISGSYGDANNYFWIFQSSRSYVYFLAKLSDRISYFDPATDPSGSVTLYVSSFIAGIQVDSIQLNGAFYLASESTPIIKISERASGGPLDATYIKPSPGGNIVQSHIDRLLVAGSTITGQSMRVYYSSSSIEQWRAVDYFDVNPVANNEYVSGLGPSIYGNMPLYTNKTTRLVTGTDYGDEETDGNISVRLISDSVGCVHQRTIKSMKNKQLFFSAGTNGTQPGIYEMNGVSVKERTVRYRRFFRDHIQTSTNTIPSAFVYKDTYCLSVATKAFESSIESNAQKMLICIDENDRITTNFPSIIGQLQLINGIGYALTNESLLRDPTFPTWHVFRYDTGLKDSFVTEVAPSIVETNIPWSYKTKDFTMGDANDVREKTAERLYIQCSGSSGTLINVRANFDFGKSSMTWAIDTSSNYRYGGNIQTVTFTSAAVLNKLLFPKKAGQDSNFTWINFELFASSPTYVSTGSASVSFLDFWATPKPMR